MMRMARAMILMGLGRLKEGFDAYEVRLDPEMPEAMHVVVDAPRWDPETQDIRGKRAAGRRRTGHRRRDGLRRLPARRDRGRRPGRQGLHRRRSRAWSISISAASPPPSSAATGRCGIEGRLTRYCPFMEEIGETDGKADVWTPMASLCAVYRQDLSDFPDRDGYLVPDPAKVAHWKAELEKLGPGLKVGLHWKSLILTGVRARYFSSFERWKPVLTAPGCVMVNLQCGDVTDDLAAAEAAGVKIWTPPIEPQGRPGRPGRPVQRRSTSSSARASPAPTWPRPSGARTWLIHAPDDWHLLATDRYPFYPRVRTFATGGFDGWPRAIAEVRAALEAEVA